MLSSFFHIGTEARARCLRRVHRASCPIFTAWLSPGATDLEHGQFAPFAGSGAE